LITRLEHFTKRRPWFSDITVGACATAYLGLVLFDDVESPLLSLAFIILAAYKLIEPHLLHNEPRP
jgi:hypothetical protein